MNRLDELIRELCPDGVEFCSLGSVCEIRSGWGFPNAEQGKKIGDIPFFKVGDMNNPGNEMFMHTSNNYIDWDTVKRLKCNPAPKDTIIFPKIGAAIGTNKKRILISDACYDNNVMGLIASTRISPRFLFYIMQSVDLMQFTDSAGAVPSIRKTTLEKFEIPVPPLEVQSEIVRILDTFTELSAELLAELLARKKQYEYYHNALMDFSGREIQYKSVGELFEIKNGLNKEKEAFGKGHPIINFTDVFIKRWLGLGSFKGLVDVTAEEIERYSARKGDVFFTRTSETKEDIGMSSTLIEDVPNCVFSGFVLRARPLTDLLLPKFCSYYFSTKQVRSTIVRYAAFTTRATTTGPKLSKIMVPILPIEEQARIVAILDRFDALCNDISAGLPAEIEARRKQYEYYRDKLLTFTPAAN